MKQAKAVFWEVVRPLIAISAAFAIGFVIVWISGLDPVEAYGIMFKKGFMTWSSLQETMERMVPLTFTGLAVAMAFRAGIFNMGIEGSLYLGGMAGFYVGYALKLPPGLHSIAAIAAGAVVGALWALPPAIARVKWQAREVVSTIMLNYVAILFTSYLVGRVFKDTTAGAQQTWPIKQSAELFRFFETSRVHTGLLLAVGLALLLAFFLFRTSGGYELRMVGQNPLFAEYAGIKTGRVILQAMLVSGALGGIAGAVEILGIHHRFMDLFSPGYGFDGVVIALTARNHPIGVIVAAFLYSGFKTGAAYMDRLTDVPKELNDALQGIMIFLVAAEGLFAFNRKGGAISRMLKGLTDLFGRSAKKEAA